MTLELATHEFGAERGTAPTVVMVHGWPDSAEVWEPVARRLGDAFHVVTIDLPGAGDSPAAAGKGAFRLDTIAEQVDRVIGRLPSDRPIHLVGHDWGGVIGWRYVMRPEFGGRLSSFTALSAPSLDHMALLVRRSTDDRDLAAVSAGQMLKSWYTWPLSTPWLRTAMWRHGGDRVFRRWLKRSEGITDYPGDGLAADAIALVPLYRANIVPRLLFPSVTEIDIPVHVIVAERDRYVDASLMRTLDRWVPDLEFSSVDAGHWAIRSHPDDVATLIRRWLTAQVTDTDLSSEPAV